jgi:hypothetical protein
VSFAGPRAAKNAAAVVSGSGGVSVAVRETNRDSSAANRSLYAPRERRQDNTSENLQ